MIPNRTVPLPVKFRTPEKPEKLFWKSARDVEVLMTRFRVPAPVTAPIRRKRLGVRIVPIRPEATDTALE